MIRSRVEVLKQDITTLSVDVIVNAANSSLVAGGGVDGAIHRAAGPRLQEECRRLKGCPTGEAKISGGYSLPASHVIHTVGPIWRGGENKEDELLASCYRKSLQLALDHNLKTIAFPSISTGAYRFPLERAVRIAVSEVKLFLEAHETPAKVIFVCFGPGVWEGYQTAIAEILA